VVRNTFVTNQSRIFLLLDNSFKGCEDFIQSGFEKSEAPVRMTKKTLERPSGYQRESPPLAVKAGTEGVGIFFRVASNIRRSAREGEMFWALAPPLAQRPKLKDKY
jgi:hypothetical protein